MGTPFNVPLILASTSPRRIELMNQVQLLVQVERPDADETPRRGESPRALVLRLSRAKGESVLMDALREHGAAMIIAADTIVVSPDGKKILGKPKDADEAKRMLKMLAGKTHTVLTGYCLIAAAREEKPRILSRVISSKVKMRPLNNAAIARYVASGEPMDKAGGYAAQGLGTALIEKISGSYTNVVGLPISDLLLDFENKFDLPLFGWIGGVPS